MKKPTLLQGFCVIAVITALGLTGVWGASFYNRIVIYRNRERYQSQNFVVRDAVYVDDIENGDTYWLEGSINGIQERLIPAGRGIAVPRSRRELNLKYPRGATLPVLYNPEVSQTFHQRESLRVVEATPDFWEREAEWRHRLAWRTFLPIPLTGVLLLTILVVRRRRSISSAPRIPC